MSTPRSFGVSARVSRMALRMLLVCTTCAAPKLPRRFHLAIVLHNRNRFASRQRRHVQHHQAQRPAANDRHRSPGRGCESSKPCTAQASGSVSAACSSGT